MAYLTNVPMNSAAIRPIADGLDRSADILKFGRHYGVAGFDVYTVRQPSGGKKIKYGVLSDKRKYIVAEKGIYYIEK